MRRLGLLSRRGVKLKGKAHDQTVFKGTTLYSSSHAPWAVDLLEKGFEDGDFRMILLKASPWFDPLRSHPRFQGLLRRINFPR